MINDIVKQMLEEHEGGEVFFDNLDEAVRNNDILSSFWQYVWDNILFDKYDGSDIYDDIILSGKFGRAILNHTDISYDCSHYIGIECIVVNGSLRKGDEVDDFVLSSPNGKKFLFLDDSFYSGKTRDKIAEKLKSYGAELTHTHVLYDGCYETHDDVSSMYRYYDNH